MLNTAGTPVVEARDVTVALGGRPVLRGNNLTIREGEFVALLGANGSGKSTLVRALTGLLPLTQGSVLLFGAPLGDFKARHRIGYVPQRGTAAGGVPANVREVVSSGRLTRRRLLRLPGRADRAAIDDALGVVGLSDKASDSVSTLSGGQQQRVLIARALAGEPDLFFLDEPAAGVDLPSQLALADALGILSGRGASIVLVAHELGPLEPLVDRAVVMRGGRIAYDGTPLSHEDIHGHHHPVSAPHDHVPHVGSPFDTLPLHAREGGR